jgi:hypothetical protein
MVTGDDGLGTVRLAHERRSPGRQVWRRVVLAAVVLAVSVVVVYLGRDGYRDVSGNLVQRPVDAAEVGREPRQLRDMVLSVVRGGRSLRFDDATIGTLRDGDVLVVVHSTRISPRVGPR